MVYGESGAGKSFLALDMALHVANGKEWQDKKTKKGAVFYVAGEGQTGITARCHAWALHHDVDLENVPFYCTDGAVIPTDDKQLDDLFSDITHWIESTGEQPLLVFFDTLARCFDGDENSAKDAGRYIQAIDKIKKRFKCCVVTVHHTGKDTGRGGRGSSAFKGAWDMEHALSVKDGGIKQLETTKAKDIAAPIDKFFTLESVKTNWLDDDMEVITSAVMVSTEYTPIKGSRLNGRQQDVLTELHKAIEQHGIEPTSDIKALFPDSPQNIPAKVVNLSRWRELAYKVITIDGESNNIAEAKKKAFQYCIKVLKESGKIGFYDGYAWTFHQGDNGTKRDKTG
jgi:RecA-family ATPase